MARSSASPLCVNVFAFSKQFVFFPGWAHVVCALYIQEVSFGDMAALEPIIVTNVPKERFKQTCSICTERQQNHLAGQGAVICYNRWFIVG